MLDAKPLVMVLPIGTEADFVGVVDLLTQKAYVWDDSGQPENFEVQEVPEDMKELVEKYRFELIESAVEQDDDAMEQYLEGNEPDLETIKKRCIRKGTRELAFFPTYCGSAFKNKGIQLVLDAVVDYPAGPDRGSAAAGDRPRRPRDRRVRDRRFADKPVRALAFKIMDDRFGALTFVRVYSGTINKGDTLVNTFTGKNERIGRMVEMHADDRTIVDSVQAGDIVAMVGLKDVRTGNTLADQKNPATLEPMVFPDPVISVAVGTKDKANSEKLSTALGKMIAEDPSFRVEVDQESGETILKGMGELHLDIKVDILRRSHGVEVEVGAPQVAYRETVTKPDLRQLHAQEADRRLGSVREDRLRDRAGGAGEGFVFESNITGGNIPKEFIPAVEKGFKTMMEEGPLCGFPLLDFKVVTERRWVPRGRLVADGVRDRRQGRVPSEHAEGGAAASRADHEGRRLRARRQRRRRHRRPQPPARHRELPGEGAHQRSHQGGRPAQRDVRLHRRPSLCHLGPRPVLDGVQELCAGASRNIVEKVQAEVAERKAANK